MKVCLTISRPGAAPETVEVEQPAELLVGRVSQCQICLAGDVLISRQHAVIAVNPPSVRIKDLDSTNGMSVNGMAYGGKSGRKRDDFIALRHGDKIMVGKTRIRVEVTGLSETTIVPVNRAGGANPDKAEICMEALSIPGYKLLQSLGSGGMGAVFLALEESSGRLAAIKTMAGRHALNERLINTFNREIKISKALDHPNIVKFLGSGVTPDRMLYLVLEYVNGGNLSVWARRYPERRMPLEEAFAMLLELADGMACAHRMNFVHRDIKPQNILVEDSRTCRRAKLTDLGLAKNFEQSGLSGMAASFSGGGTIAYMPPEQLTDFRDAKPSSDVFSLMATFYEMLTGRGPYNFRASGDEIRVVSICDTVPIAKRMDGLPDALVRILDRSLRAEEGERYQNCGELLNALKSVRL